MLWASARVLDYAHVSLRRRCINYSGAAPAILTYCGSTYQGPTAGTHTYNGVSFGPASADRAIILCALVSANVSSVTIGGISATRLARRIQSVNNTVADDIWIAAVPSGTSGSISLIGQTGTSQWISYIGVYSATRLRSLTPTDEATSDDWNGSSYDRVVSTSVGVQGGGFAVSSGALTGGQAMSAIWTGGTQDYFVEPLNFGGISGAHYNATGPQSVTFTTKFYNSSSGLMMPGICGVTCAFR